MSADKDVQVGNDQEMAQSERKTHSKNEVGKTKLTIKYNLVHVSITKLLVLFAKYNVCLLAYHFGIVLVRTIVIVTSHCIFLLP